MKGNDKIDTAEIRRRLEAAGKPAPDGKPHAEPAPKTDAKAKKPPRRYEPYLPPPLDALAPPLDTYARQAADALGCDPGFVLPGLPAVVASVIGNSRAIELKRGWRE